MKDDFWVWVFGALVLCFLFEGEPDVWDKLRERVIQGETKLNATPLGANV